MKKNIKYFVSFLFASLLLTVSCVKDDGNYDYTELPKMEIADYSITSNDATIPLMDDNTIFIGKNNHVVITPNYVMDKEIKAKYVWSIMPKVQPANPLPLIPADTLGREATLDYVFAQIPGKYVLVLEVSNDVVGADFKNIVKFNLIIEAVNGIGVLHTRGGKGDVSVFKTNEIDANVPEDGYTMKGDVISTVNGGMLLNNPTFIDCDYNTKNKYNIGTSDGVSTFNIEFGFVSNNELKYAVATPAPTPAIPQSLFSSDPNYTFSFMVMNDRLWARTGSKVMMCTNVIYRFNNDDYHPFVLVDDNTTGHIAFNKTSKGFEYLRQGSGMIEVWGSSNPYYPQLIVSTGEVLINDTKMDLIAFGHSVGKMLAIMKDASSQLRAVRFTYPESKDSKPTATFESNNNISALEGMNENVVWEFGTRGQYAFYGSGSNLYIYNSDKNTSSNANLSIPSDEKITKISILTYRKSDIEPVKGKKDEYKEKRNGSVIFVATLKNGEGAIYQFSINPANGRPDISSKKVITGFGEIKDIKLIR